MSNINENLFTKFIILDSGYSLDPDNLSFNINSSKNEKFKLIQKKSNLTAIIQHSLSRYFDFILPIHKYQNEVSYEINTLLDQINLVESFSLNEFFYYLLMYDYFQQSIFKTSLTNFTLYSKDLNDDENISLYLTYIGNRCIKPGSYTFINDDKINKKFYFSFNKPIRCMINSIVVPVEDEESEKKYYIKGLFYLAKKNFKQAEMILENFGTQVVNIFREAVDKNNISLLDNIILLDFPSFSNFVDIFNLYKNENLVLEPESFKHQILKEDTQETVEKYVSLLVNEKPMELNTSNLFYKFGDFEKLIYSTSEKYQVDVYYRLFKNFYIFFKSFDNSMDEKTKNKIESFNLIRKFININTYFESMLYDIFYCINKISLKTGQIYLSKLYSNKKNIYTLFSDITQSPVFFDFLYNFIELEAKNFTPKGTRIYDVKSYLPTYSLNQLNVLFNVDLKSIISLILKVVFNNKDIEHNSKLVNKILSEKSTDIDKYIELFNIKKQSYIPEEFDRGIIRYNQIEKLNFFNILRKRKTPLNKNSYLDFGGGIGDITYSIAKELKLEKENVYVTDVKNWFGELHTDKYIENINYVFLKTNILPFEDNKFDFISCFQVFHHLPNLDFSLNQLHRVLKNDGYLIVREHSAETYIDQLLIDVEHSLYECVVTPVEKYMNSTQIESSVKQYLHNYNDHYFSRNNLFQYMNKYFDYVTEDLGVKLNYQPPQGITKYYFSVWKKKSDLPATKSLDSATSLEEIDYTVLEKELLRKKYYQQIISDFTKLVNKYKLETVLTTKEIYARVVTYLFNKQIENLNPTDYVFVNGTNTYAAKQFQKDFDYFKIKVSSTEFINMIEQYITKANSEISKVGTFKSKDENLASGILNKNSNEKFVYKNVEISDINKVISNEGNIERRILLLASSMRYKYMGIATHSLSLDYKELGYSKEEACEGFGGVFNHYFNCYGSAFPDLEKSFGSFGNFFAQNSFPAKIVHVNPPYDETIMLKSLEKVQQMLDGNPEYTFILTFPDWSGFLAKERALKDPRTFKVDRFKKGELLFIDYFEDKKYSPVAIIQIYIGKNNLSSSIGVSSSAEELKEDEMSSSNKYLKKMTFVSSGFTSSQEPKNQSNETKFVTEAKQIKTNYTIDKDYIKFYSNASKSYYKLSNFAHVKEGITVDGITYPSSEHAFQAQKFIEKDKQRFSVTGDLGKIDTGFRLVYPKETSQEVESKKDYWMKKDNIGIIAKMATSESLIKNLKLTLISNFKSSDELWMKILTEKYKVKEFKDLLLSTGNHYLLEFDKGAERKTKDGSPPYYNGMIDSNLKLYGTNKMGIYLMNVRDEATRRD